MSQVVRGVRNALRSTENLGLRRLFSAAGTRFQHSAAASGSAGERQQQSTSVDPFTSALQSKTEKELMDQMLRQAEEQEQAEDAAEKVWP
jgi:proline dehydrogenase